MSGFFVQVKKKINRWTASAKQKIPKKKQEKIKQDKARKDPVESEIADQDEARQPVEHDMPCNQDEEKHLFEYTYFAPVVSITVGCGAEPLDITHKHRNRLGEMIVLSGNGIDENRGNSYRQNPKQQGFSKNDLVYQPMSAPRAQTSLKEDFKGTYLLENNSVAQGNKEMPKPQERPYVNVKSERGNHSHSKLIKTHIEFIRKKNRAQRISIPYLIPKTVTDYVDSSEVVNDYHNVLFKDEKCLDPVIPSLVEDYEKEINNLNARTNSEARVYGFKDETLIPAYENCEQITLNVVSGTLYNSEEENAKIEVQPNISSQINVSNDKVMNANLCNEELSLQDDITLMGSTGEPLIDRRSPSYMSVGSDYEDKVSKRLLGEWNIEDCDVRFDKLCEEDVCLSVESGYDSLDNEDVLPCESGEHDDTSKQNLEVIQDKSGELEVSSQSPETSKSNENIEAVVEKHELGRKRDEKCKQSTVAVSDQSNRKKKEPEETRKYANQWKPNTPVSGDVFVQNEESIQKREHKPKWKSNTMISSEPSTRDKNELEQKTQHDEKRESTALISSDPFILNVAKQRSKHEKELAGTYFPRNKSTRNKLQEKRNPIVKVTSSKTKGTLTKKNGEVYAKRSRRLKHNKSKGKSTCIHANDIMRLYDASRQRGCFNRFGPISKSSYHGNISFQLLNPSILNRITVECEDQEELVIDHNLDECDFDSFLDSSTVPRPPTSITSPCYDAEYNLPTQWRDNHFANECYSTIEEFVHFEYLNHPWCYDVDFFQTNFSHIKVGNLRLNNSFGDRCTTNNKNVQTDGDWIEPAGTFNHTTLLSSRSPLNHRQIETDNRPRYPIRYLSNSLGIVVVIVIDAYENLLNREGSEKDSENLIELWLSRGFEVHKYQDPKRKQIEEIVNYYKGLDHSMKDAFVTCISSHGYQGHILDGESKSVSIWNDIMAPMCDVASLQDKPKIGCIQACQNIRTISGNGFPIQQEIGTPTPSDIGWSEEGRVISQESEIQRVQGSSLAVNREVNRVSVTWHRQRTASRFGNASTADRARSGQSIFTDADSPQGNANIYSIDLRNKPDVLLSFGSAVGVSRRHSLYGSFYKISLCRNMNYFLDYADFEGILRQRVKPSVEKISLEVTGYSQSADCISSLDRRFCLPLKFPVENVYTRRLALASTEGRVYSLN